MTTRLTPNQISKLGQLINPKYTLATLEIAVYSGLGVHLDHYSTLSGLPALIIELCTRVNEEGHIPELVTGLKTANRNPDLSAAFDALLAPAPVGAGLCQALLLRPEPPLTLINRQTLRDYLVQLTTIPAFRVISITGPSACGKTHSKEFIRFVAEAGGFTHLQIDVVDETRALTLRQVLDKIALGLRYAFSELKTLLSDEPTDAQAAERFVDWISSQSRDFVPAGRHFWLTFDGLDRPGAASTRDNLVPMLLRAVANNNLQNVKLFLLGDNGKRIRDARAIVLHEDAPQMTRGEIRQFLENYAVQSKGWQIPNDELDELADFVIRGLPWPFDHKSMDSISEKIEIALGMIDAAAAAAAEAGREGPPPAGGPMPLPPAGGPVASLPGG